MVHGQRSVNTMSRYEKVIASGRRVESGLYRLNMRVSPTKKVEMTNGVRDWVSVWPGDVVTETSDDDSMVEVVVDRRKVRQSVGDDEGRQSRQVKQPVVASALTAVSCEKGSTLVRSSRKKHWEPTVKSVTLKAFDGWCNARMSKVRQVGRVVSAGPIVGGRRVEKVGRAPKDRGGKPWVGGRSKPMVRLKNLEGQVVEHSSRVGVLRFEIGARNVGDVKRNVGIAAPRIWR